MEAYVATYGRSTTTHAIRGEWRYDDISSARTKCGRRGPFAVNHLNPGQGIEVTCKSCAKSSEV